MSACSFTMETETGTDISYCATGVMYVPLNTMTSVFQFETTEISNNTLSSAIFDNSSDITYYVNSSSYPIINSVHASMNNSLSEGAMINDTSYNTLKFDKIFYDIEQLKPGSLWWATNLQYEHLSSSGYNLLTNTNITGILDDVELIGWNQKISIETILSNADNSGNGLTNSNTTDNNVTRVLLKQLAYFDSDRLTTTNSNSINNTTNKQNFPFIEGDKINYFITLTSDDDDIPDRIYRIMLYLTSITTNVNSSPVYSLVDSNDATVTDKGVPTIPIPFPAVFGNRNIETAPAYGNYDYSQTGMIYLSSELSALKERQITGIELNFNGWATNYPLNNQVIKMGHISANEFDGTNVINYSDISGQNNTAPTMTAVKSYFNMTIESSSHWKRFDFDTNFYYNGTSNLLISWENQDGSWQDNYGYLEGTSVANDDDGTPSYRVSSWFNDNNYPSTTNSSSPQSRIPNIIFHFV